MFSTSSMVSRVVPAISLTIARFSLSSAFNRVDLPAFGFANNGNLYAVFDHIAQLKGMEEFLNGGLRLIDQSIKPRAVGKLHILLREIQLQFDQGRKGQ